MQKKPINEDDIHFMKKVLSIAKKGAGTVSPNPMVGAILVKDRKIISSGYHKMAGSYHAEIIAIKKAGERAKGSTLYVNLEPCVHRGRTGPCCDVIKDAGITRVVAATKDPNPLVRGKGFKKLKESGLKVTEGVLEEEAQVLNEIFFKYITTRLPFTVLKTAASLDGRIATNNGESKWITSENSRKIVHRLRATFDAVLVGSNTVIKDNPQLTCRLVSAKRDPAVIIVDNKLSVPTESEIFKTKGKRKVIIATIDNSDNRRKGILFENLGAELLFFKGDDRKHVSLFQLMRVLGKREITSVLIEGGSSINADAIKSDIVDKFYFFFAPMLFGGEKAKGIIGGEGIENIKSAYQIEIENVRRVNRDILLIGRKPKKRGM
ncbi:MAG: bifunctional diaminohydroxyphosphoribosylaminopyrimidine deaminase/5-amino-6-(5-phosphoribosylamino)uracil reductase RibD [Candidatus Schekmanbacteria bacterium]|nr:bifunctional diaminohydroxyphosphoribosylaminopyrimidine deaminase/5-amino-6-(5-phosphoribosylamino)uracil reductase RibD [Candidatus Schekmanbacteria bacterium]